jgi:two-component system, NtrC family, nitrogen regulation sensor histidine kinase NtrY
MLGNLGAFLKKRIHFYLFIVLLIPLLWLQFTLPSPSTHNLDHLQSVFSNRQSEAETFANSVKSEWLKDDLPQFDQFCATENKGFFVHVYRRDSLIYWNSNSLPINRFAELHFPVAGLNQLENGWYYTVLKEYKNLLFAVSFGVQHKYPYSNDYLRNDFFEPFGKEHFVIDVEAVNPVLRDNKGNTLVGLSIADDFQHHQTPLVWMFILIMLMFIVVWHYLSSRLHSTLSRIILALAVASVPFACLFLNPFSWLENTSLLDAAILALGEWIPNMAILIVWAICGILTGLSLAPIFLRRVGSPLSLMIALVLMPLCVPAFPMLAAEILENSSLSPQLTNIIQLDIYSYILLALIAITGWWYIQLSFYSFKSILKWKNSKVFLLLYLVFIAGVSVLITLAFSKESVALLIWPLLVFYAVGWLVGWKNGRWTFNYILVVLLLFSAATTINIDLLSNQKEREIREVYARNLAEEQDINTEVEFANLKSQIQHEPYCKRLFDTSFRPSTRELKEVFEHRFFNGYWEQYDLDCFYFRNGDDGKSGEYTQAELEKLIGTHGKVSEIDPDLYLIQDDQSQFVYCFKLPIYNSDSTESIMLYGGLKSKRIPEEIGFPRLLISDKTNVFEALSEYSIAKYLNDKLIRNEGDAEYPRDIKTFTNWKGKGIHWVETDEMSHVIYKSSGKNALVLSKAKTDFIDSVTAISFLVITYGILFLIFRLVMSNSIGKTFELSSLATRIQLVMIILVVLSLIGFSIGSGTFIRNQYDNNSKSIIRQKLRSLHIEALNKRNIFNIREQQNLEEQLIDWSRTYQTDINFYQPEGFLIASSRQKLYNIGLLGEEMQPQAIREMKFKGKSECIIKEQIGSLGFYAAYIPLSDNKGNLLGYINVQHFAQQGEFENQVQSFFVAILNVVMFLLVLSIVGAVFVSGWITKPLRMIRKSVSNVSFGQHNAHIAYKSNDEIGALVAEYNKKLTELDEAALKLAQSEREGAWREMAKQVAHEIKNPLTPMKLSVQHLQRVFDPSDPASAEKITKVTNALIEQIEALTGIANAFSNFAKLPQPIMTNVDLVEVLKNVISLFENNSEADVVLNNPYNSLPMQADKEMLVRVFNNIIANGIQAVIIGKHAEIKVNVKVERDNVYVSISDNGSGIKEEQINTIFEPYFTTKTTGTGLGLAMVKQIIAGHNGDIYIEKTSEKGTTMVVRLPLKP